MTYLFCKTIITNKTYKSIQDMQTKLDVFLLNDRIAQSEYNELVAMLSAQKEVI
jgi:low affinity Fe/Cu permease